MFHIIAYDVRMHSSLFAHNDQKRQKEGYYKEQSKEQRKIRRDIRSPLFPCIFQATTIRTQLVSAKSYCYILFCTT